MHYCATSMRSAHLRKSISYKLINGHSVAPLLCNCNWAPLLCNCNWAPLLCNCNWAPLLCNCNWAPLLCNCNWAPLLCNCNWALKVWAYEYKESLLMVCFLYAPGKTYTVQSHKVYNTYSWLQFVVVGRTGHGQMFHEATHCNSWLDMCHLNKLHQCC